MNRTTTDHLTAGPGNRFAYRRAEPDDTSPADAAGDVALAGGTDLIPLHKLGLVSPETLVDLKTSAISRGIERDDDGWRLGALATLSDIEDHAALRSEAPVVHAAVTEAATRQLRNRATVGGNLLQRPRCRYYRNEGVDCWFNGGTTCPAREGRNEHHAIFDTGPCIAVQPSDLASALVALDASVELTDGSSMSVGDLLAPPDGRRSLNILEPDQTIDAVVIPTGDAAGAVRRSAYRKVMARAGWAFALVGVAAVVDVLDREVTDARLVASGVAATPWRLRAAEERLIGSSMTATDIEAAAACATDGAVDFGENAYKQPMLTGTVAAVLSGLSDR